MLKFYDPRAEVTLQCDASEYGLDATLLQGGQPVAFASRTFSRTERNYAQLEKEGLAIVFGCQRFDQYLARKDKIVVETDHKPLQPIFKKPIHAAPCHAPCHTFKGCYYDCRAIILMSSTRKAA